MPLNLLSPEFVKGLKRLDLRAKAIVEGFLAGLHLSVRPGFSVEFSDYRDYVFGDSLDDIDWKLYARTDKFYVKRFQAETNMRCTVILDKSASMGYASGGMAKLEYAVSLAAALSYMMISQNDRVGLMLCDEKVREHVPAKSKRAHLFRLWETLARVRASGKTDLPASLSSAAELMTKRGLVVILSDFFGDASAVAREVQHLRFRGQDVILFHVLDPTELEYPFGSPVLLRDPETGRTLAGDPGRERTAYAAAVGRLMSELKLACARARADYGLLVTSDPFDRALADFLYRRAKRA